jgi:HAD superfamily hydrolase (TIGR01490 family)
METLVIAVFDFDGTLVENDSFFPFLAFVAGWPRTFAVFLEALGLFALHRLRDDPAAEDHRTFIKAYMMKKLLAGTRVEGLPSALGRLRNWRRWKESIRATLMRHHEAGHHIVIASGGLDLYLPYLLEDLPHHAIVCTRVGVADGVVTGEMISGNCVRVRKAELVAEYIAKNGPFGESWGYGNLPHDLPMLELLTHRVVV